MEYIPSRQEKELFRPNLSVGYVWRDIIHAFG